MQMEGRQVKIKADALTEKIRMAELVTANVFVLLYDLS